MPVEETYRALLRAAVERVGGQGAAAELAGINQATVSRALAAGGRATYTTLEKLRRALPGLPAAVVSIRDEAHEEWCTLGARLEAERPAIFGVLLTAVREALPAPAITDESIDHIKNVANGADRKVGRHRKRG